MNPVKAPWETLGEEFVKAYYNTFDTNRDQLVVLYAPDAMFTFEEHRAQGQAGIKEILTDKLRFTTIQHIVTKVDCQPTAENGILVLVTGKLKTDDDPPHAYSQTFYVKPFNNSYFIFHDIFRLSIHNIWWWSYAVTTKLPVHALYDILRWMFLNAVWVCEKIFCCFCYIVMYWLLCSSKFTIDRVIVNFNGIDVEVGFPANLWLELMPWWNTWLSVSFRSESFAMMCSFSILFWANPPMPFRWANCGITYSGLLLDPILEAGCDRTVRELIAFLLRVLGNVWHGSDS